jgi:peroxiredoxin
MRRVAWYLALAFLGFLTFRSLSGGCAGALPEVGSPAPAFSAAGPQGPGQWSSAGFEGRPHVLLFFATWCSACSRELPAVDRIHREHPELGIVLVTDESVDVATAYLKKRGFDLPLAGSAGDVLRAHGVAVLPSAVAVDATGKVAAASQGGGAMGRVLRKAVRAGER